MNEHGEIVCEECGNSGGVEIASIKLYRPCEKCRGEVKYRIDELVHKEENRFTDPVKEEWNAKRIIDQNINNVLAAIDYLFESEAHITSGGSFMKATAEGNEISLQFYRNDRRYNISVENVHTATELNLKYNKFNKY
jgi:hypothetical protein